MSRDLDPNSPVSLERVKNTYTRLKPLHSDESLTSEGASPNFWMDLLRVGPTYEELFNVSLLPSLLRSNTTFGLELALRLRLDF